MFAVIYKFKLKPHQEETYKKQWHKVASFFINHCGAIGSCLHKGDNNIWVAYSRWPNQETRDAAWPKDSTLIDYFPLEVKAAIAFMKSLQEENQDLENHYEEICLTVVDDLNNLNSV